MRYIASLEKGRRSGGGSISSVRGKEDSNVTARLPRPFLARKILLSAECARYIAFRCDCRDNLSRRVCARGVMKEALIYGMRGYIHIRLYCWAEFCISLVDFSVTSIRRTTIRIS